MLVCQLFISTGRLQYRRLHVLIVMVALRNRADHYIFALWFLFFFLFFLA